MHISALEEYGLRVLVSLGRAYVAGNKLSASILARQEGISVEYASKLLFLFRKSGLVGAERGAQGGFYLMKDPALINVKEVLKAVQGKKKSEGHCKCFTGQQEECVHLNECSTRPVWSVLMEYFDNLTQKISLADFLRKETEMHTYVRGLAISQNEKIQSQFQSSTIKNSECQPLNKTQESQT